MDKKPNGLDLSRSKNLSLPRTRLRQESKSALDLETGLETMADLEYFLGFLCQLAPYYLNVP